MESKPVPAGRVFSILDSRVEPDRLVVQNGDGVETGVRPRSMAVLKALVDAGNRVVTKNELLDTVWPRAQVTEGVLSQAILELRTAFGDDPKKPRYIETIRGVGFRLVPTVRWHGLEAVVVPHPMASRDLPRSRRGPRWLLAGVCATLIVAATVYFWLVQKPAVAPPPFVMVVPFEEIGPGSREDYFAAGMADEIAQQLAQSDTLRIFSSQATRRLLADGKQPDAIAEQYGVDLVLSGSVRRQGDELRVVAELFDAEDGEQRWMTSFDRELGDVFDIQIEIARAVAAEVTGQQELTDYPVRTSNLTAYDLYLRGKAFAGLHRYDANEQAIRLFREALDLEPAFSPARAQLAEALAVRGYVFQRGDESLYEAIAEAELALTVDRTSVTALFAKSQALSALGRFDEALMELREAVRVAPNDSDAAFGIAYLSEVRGELGEAFTNYRRALELDPTQPRTVALAQLLYLMGREDEAVRTGRRADLLAPGMSTVYLSHLYALMGRQNLARETCSNALAAELPRALNLCGFGEILAGDLATAQSLLARDWQDDPRSRYGPFTFAPSATHLAWIRMEQGLQERGLDLLEESERVTREAMDRGIRHWALYYNLAAIASLRDDRDLAMERLDAAYSNGFRNYRLLELDPVLQPLADLPEFAALETRIRDEFATLAGAAERDPSGQTQ